MNLVQSAPDRIAHILASAPPAPALKRSPAQPKPSISPTTGWMCFAASSLKS